MDLLEVKNLNLGFETEQGFKQALYDISFSLKSGKMHAIVGESGCGKTMSAMSIIKLMPKNAKIISGEIFFNKKNLLSLHQGEIQKIRGKKIALIPQDPMTSLNPLYTIGNQLLEIIKKHQPDLNNVQIKKRAIEALKAVQIPEPEKRMHAYPHEFSGGMKQRAIIAMALACNAEIIIADEPTTALDVTIQAQIMKLLKKIKENTNASILLITHDLALVEECADEVSVMYAGRIVEHAIAQEFFANPKHPYSKALLGSLPNEKNERIKTIKGQPPSINQEIAGCKFNPRCEKVLQICTEKVPDLKEIASGHYCSCYNV